MSQISTKSIKARLTALEGVCKRDEVSMIVERLIEQGAFYDDLKEDEKNAVCAYYDTDRSILEEVEMIVMGTLHFQVAKREKSLTEAQFEERVQEVERLLGGRKE